MNQTSSSSSSTADAAASVESNNDHHIQEVLQLFPTLQYGMDVNPKFTSGPDGVEYTMQMNAFDLLHIELVHGWLIEPDAQEYELIANQTYNQLINMVILGNDASASLAQNPQAPDFDQLSMKATKGTLIHQFLERSSHQLTQYGLTVLHEYLRDGQMVVFFRNNHFNTLTKHNGLLYLLVTDFGYSNVQSVVWEKIDVIDGDTEYVGANFKPPSSPMEHSQQNHGAVSGEQMVSNNLQSQADYQLALQLNRETSLSGVPMPPQQDREMEAARQASLLLDQQQNQQATMVAVPPSPAATSTSTATATATAAPVNPSTAMVPISATIGSSTTGTAPAVGVPTVAVGIPAEAPSQEDQDLMLALQLQRQEEREQQQRNNNGRASHNLASAVQSREKHKQRQRVSRGGLPPGRQPTAPSGRSNNKKDASNCVIS